MKQSYLIQRLAKPHPGSENNPFNFGGGLLRGGMKETAYKLLNQIFRFDYMGAAEFEFGIVPETLDAICVGVEKGDCVTGELKILGVPVYYLCHKSEEKEVRIRIEELAKNKIRLKEWSCFDEAVAARIPENTIPEKKDKYKFASEFIGWLELDNKFIFFVDKPAFEKFCKLFGATEVKS
jgi:hypothetical protein